MSFQGGTVVKNLPASAGDARDGSTIPGWGRFPGVGSDNPLQCFCLENPMDRGTWQVKVHGIAISQKQLSNWTLKCMWIIAIALTFHFLPRNSSNGIYVWLGVIQFKKDMDILERLQWKLLKMMGILEIMVCKGKWKETLDLFSKKRNSARLGRRQNYREVIFNCSKTMLCCMLWLVAQLCPILDCIFWKICYFT